MNWRGPGDDDETYLWNLLLRDGSKTWIIENT